MYTYRPIIFVQDWEDDYMGDDELAQLLDSGDAQAIVEYLAQWDNHEDDDALARDWPTWRGGAGTRDDCELVEHDTFTYLLTINHGLRYVGLDRLINNDMTLEDAIALVGHGFHPDTTEYAGLTDEQNYRIQLMLDTYDPRRDVYLDALEILENM